MPYPLETFSRIMKALYILKVFLFAGVYIVLAKAGLLLALDGGFASPVWLGSGTALTLLLFNGRAMWPAITIGAFLVNWISGASIEFSLVVCAGNTLEALVAFGVLVYFKSQAFLFLKLKSVITFLLASAFGSLISAGFGGLAYWLFHPHETNLPETIGTWWLGDFTSFLLIVPIVFLFNKSVFLLPKNKYSFICFPLIISACIITFLIDFNSAILPKILIYSLFVFPIFAALIQNSITAMFYVFIIECFAVVATINNKGPFVFPVLNDSLVILQSFMSILTIVTLIITVGIKERELIKDELNVLLSEKEMLLSEIHHRIKNNLGVVSGLLYLQNETIEDDEIKNKINQTDLRIKAIALVHEKLYKKSNINTVEFSDYIETLAKMISRIYESNINLILNLEKIDLPIEKAQPLGLIINELITNSYKHAFNEKINGDGEIEIRFQFTENKYFLLVRDNGKGITYSENHPDTLGTTLINTLTDQIEADMNVKVEGGTAYEFYFK